MEKPQLAKKLRLFFMLGAKASRSEQMQWGPAYRIDMQAGAAIIGLRLPQLPVGSAAFFGPNLHQMDDHFHRFFHILD